MPSLVMIGFCSPTIHCSCMTPIGEDLLLCLNCDYLSETMGRLTISYLVLLCHLLDQSLKLFAELIHEGKHLNPSLRNETNL